mmetsp:Transcript_66861/g.178758  ORF Transcript_66861/g.178758 Transcript_66861/m.178758 type:complete len:109 (+) Transcript_66861:59-385(+)|eukprot:CAMPEP_0113666488 /NCGR_PEP_ID=MMETSP0038_2-20120614/2902_1 /TAXON_ID=2898 /ORGANISM="Cryptomonas paramecium" /LENGTH=108 /DNA_ID=CAMNT_0000581985 /DNA_START=39 /DNA_END=365 /DNA_ORIENTATION=- /assembly_acc=CAM_ASM_000170
MEFEIAFKVPEARTRRKSSLAAAVESLDVNDRFELEVSWPDVSSTEVKKSPLAICVKRLAQAKCEQEGVPSQSSKDSSNAELQLQKSVNICSPILKEERGTESWRELL